jgi:hypothetical protein
MLLIVSQVSDPMNEIGTTEMAAMNQQSEPAGESGQMVRIMHHFESSADPALPLDRRGMWEGRMVNIML